MKGLFLLIILLFLASCGKKAQDYKEGDKPLFITSNPVFDSYKSNFEQDYYNSTGQSLSTSNIPINFKDIEDGNVVGRCYYIGSFREIVIDLNYWALANATKREILVFHELGHCALDRNHQELTKNGNPVSIMFPSVISDTLYNTHKTDYLEELHTQDYTDIFNAL